jgi:hypothetical protein
VPVCGIPALTGNTTHRTAVGKDRRPAPRCNTSTIHRVVLGSQDIAPAGINGRNEPLLMEFHCEKAAPPTAQLVGRNAPDRQEQYIDHTSRCAGSQRYRTTKRRGRAMNNGDHCEKGSTTLLNWAGGSPSRHQMQYIDHTSRCAGFPDITCRRRGRAMNHYWNHCEGSTTPPHSLSRESSPDRHRDAIHRPYIALCWV